MALRQNYVTLIPSWKIKFAWIIIKICNILSFLDGLMCSKLIEFNISKLCEWELKLTSTHSGDLCYVYQRWKFRIFPTYCFHCWRLRLWGFRRTIFQQLFQPKGWFLDLLRSTWSVSSLENSHRTSHAMWKIGDLVGYGALARCREHVAVSSIRRRCQCRLIKKIHIIFWYNKINPWDMK